MTWTDPLRQVTAPSARTRYSVPLMVTVPSARVSSKWEGLASLRCEPTTLPARKFRLVSVMTSSPAVSLSSLSKLRQELATRRRTVPLYISIRSTAPSAPVLMTAPFPRLTCSLRVAQSVLLVEKVAEPVTDFIKTWPDWTSALVFTIERDINAASAAYRNLPVQPGTSFIHGLLRHDGHIAGTTHTSPHLRGKIKQNVENFMGSPPHPYIV